MPTIGLNNNLFAIGATNSSSTALVYKFATNAAKPAEVVQQFQIPQKMSDFFKKIKELTHQISPKNIEQELAKGVNSEMVKYVAKICNCTPNEALSKIKIVFSKVKTFSGSLKSIVKTCSEKFASMIKYFKK